VLDDRGRGEKRVGVGHQRGGDLTRQMGLASGFVRERIEDAEGR
jgi:hypothetical protein